MPLVQAGFDPGSVDLTDAWTGKSETADTMIETTVPQHRLALYRGTTQDSAALGMTGPATIAAGATGDYVVTAFHAASASAIQLTVPDGWSVTPSTAAIDAGASLRRTSR